jgi:hypothetical protein
MLLLMRSAARGAHNIIFGAVEDKEKLVNGGFYRSAVAFFRIAKILAKSLRNNIEHIAVFLVCV